HGSRIGDGTWHRTIVVSTFPAASDRWPAKAEAGSDPEYLATAEAAINAAATRPAVTSSGMNSLDFFVRGGDNTLWHRRYDGSWHGWEPLGVLAYDPAVVYWGSGRLDIFARGTTDGYTAAALQHGW